MSDKTDVPPIPEPPPPRRITTDGRVPKPEPRIKVKIVDKKTFRSESRVNMTDDMVRVTLDMSRWQWGQLKKQIKS